MGKKIKINKGKWEANKPPPYIVQQLASVSIDSDIDRINQALDDVAYSSGFAYSSIDAELKKAYELVEELCYYIDGTIDDIENHIDEPFFEAFDNNTGILEQFEKINLDDYKTKNTLDITETIQTGEYDYRGSTYKSVSYTKELKEVGFSDLFNNMDVTGYGGMPSFAEMMKEQYKNALSNPEMTAGYKEYVEAVLHRSDIQHSVDKGGWNTVSDVLDIVGIVSLVSVFTGTNFMTEEILTDAERDAAGINTAINIALLGVTVFTAGVGTAGYLSKVGMSITAKAVVKDLAVDMVSGLASLGTINLLDAAGSPEWLSMLAGLTVSVTGGYYGSKAVNSIGKGASGADVLDDWAKYMTPEDAKKYKLWNHLRENGLDQNKINDIILTNKGLRPNPNTYLSETYIKNHLKQFDGGVTKIMTQAPTGTAGPPGGTFVMPSSVADDLIVQAGGDVSKLEKLLSLEPGALGSSPVRVDVKNPSNLRVPSGNELGANSKWLPGGNTGGGILEATITSPKPGDYIVKPIK